MLVTGLDGFVADDPEHGLFVHETRILSRYRYRIDGHVPLDVTVSNVEQHSSLGYYLTRAPHPEEPAGGRRRAEIAQQALELRLSRFVGGGMHEDVDLTNYTQQATTFRLELEVDAD